MKIMKSYKKAEYTSNDVTHINLLKVRKLSGFEWFNSVIVTEDCRYVEDRYAELMQLHELSRFTESQLAEIELEYEQAINMIDDYFNPCHDENIYGLAGIEQSLHENR